MPYSEWLELILNKLDGRVIENYCHSWELKHWYKIGYAPTQIAYVISQRPDDYLENHPQWLRPE
jgi:hypothetical protein